MSYGAKSSSRAGGTRTHNPRGMSHVLQSGSRSCFGGDEVVGQRHFRTGIEPANRFAVARRTRAEPMYSEPAVAVFQNAQRRVAKRCLRYGRPYRQRSRRLLTGPFISDETPTPFTSRSPGIATLGPSCTPSRQLGMLFQKALSEVSSRRCSWHQVNSLGCSPDGQLSVYCDLPTRFWLRYFSAPKVDVIRVGSWLVRDAGGSRTHFDRVAAGCLAIWLQRLVARTKRALFQSSSLKVVVAIDPINSGLTSGSTS